MNRRHHQRHNTSYKPPFRSKNRRVSMIIIPSTNDDDEREKKRMKSPEKENTKTKMKRRSSVVTSENPWRSFTWIIVVICFRKNVRFVVNNWIMRWTSAMLQGEKMFHESTHAISLNFLMAKDKREFEKKTRDVSGNNFWFCRGPRKLPAF